MEGYLTESDNPMFYKTEMPKLLELHQYSIISKIIISTGTKFICYQEWGNEFQSGADTEYWKVLSASMVGWQEHFLNSRRSRMAKTVTLWP